MAAIYLKIAANIENSSYMLLLAILCSQFDPTIGDALTPKLGLEGTQGPNWLL